MNNLTVEEKNNIVGTEPTKETTTQVVEEKKWTSKKELMDILQCSSDTLERIIGDLISRNDAAIENHMKKGGYNNLQVFYDDDLVKAIQLKLKQNGVSQGKQIGIIKQSNIGDMAIGFVFTSGSYEQKMDMLAFLQKQTEEQHIAEQQHKLDVEQNKLLLEQNQQMAHALDYDSVAGWKKWNEYKNELKQNIELFRHRINFETVIAEANLVEGVDYDRKLLGYDKFPTIVISSTGEDKIYDRYLI